MVDPEPFRRALLDRLRGLLAAGVTHCPQTDWDSLLTPVESESPSPPHLAEVRVPGRSADGLTEPRRNVALTDRPAAYAASPRPGASVAPTSPATVDLEPYAAPLRAEDRPSALQVIQAEVAACRSCPELVRNRTHTVFGVGNPQARLCFLGEAPGQEEDLQGEPFVGAAGQLLDKIMAACKLSRDEVFILNTLKCRPPMNRTPTETEVNQCWHFAHRQLEIIQPEFICCLGAVAAKSLLRTPKSISQLRGVFHPYRGSQVMVTYHPAYLLRTPSAKRHVWDDMKMLMRAMGVEL
jgi:uracil-DNA glycosylase family 4